jgi:hypothetical protein
VAVRQSEIMTLDLVSFHNAFHKIQKTCHESLDLQVILCDVSMPHWLT